MTTWTHVLMGGRTYEPHVLTLHEVDSDGDVGPAIAQYATEAEAEADGWHLGSWRGESLGDGADLGQHARRREPDPDPAPRGPEMADDGIRLLFDVAGVAEIAERAGVAVATVHSWRRRHAGFPRPRWMLASGPVWMWSDVVAWLAVPRPVGRRPRGR